MAEKRMFSIKVTQSARFLQMPASAQALYFHLGLAADDDGVVEAFATMRMVRAADDDLKILVAKKLVQVLNDEMVTYILDWNIHNSIRADRKKDSIYKELLLQAFPDIELVEPKTRSDIKGTSAVMIETSNNSRTDNGPTMDRPWTDNGPTMDGIDKYSIDKNRIDENNISINPSLIEQFKKQIDYDALVIDGKKDNTIQKVEEMTMIAIDVLSSNAKTIKVNGEEKPVRDVKARFAMLNIDHFRYVLDSLENSTSEVKNIRAMLITTLYNAPSTMGNYYKAKVNHDWNSPAGVSENLKLLEGSTDKGG